jgi:hypothetical protein
MTVSERAKSSFDFECPLKVPQRMTLLILELIPPRWPE